MELRHLRYMVAVAENLSYRKAAEVLHVAKPALSTQIMDLEEELGVQLFDRDKTGVRLTPAGVVFLEKARTILQQAQSAAVAAREAATGEKGRLTVGFMEALSAAFLAPGLKHFQQRYPAVEVTVREIILQKHIPALAAGEIDVGFSFGPCQTVPPSFERSIILTSTMRAVVGPGHRLAKFDRVPFAELENETQLCLSNREGTRTLHAEQTRTFLAGRGIVPVAFSMADGLESMIAMLANGQGVSLLPEMMRTTRTASLHFKPFKEAGNDLMVELAGLCRSGESSRTARNFVAAMVEANAKPA